MGKYDYKLLILSREKHTLLWRGECLWLWHAPRAVRKKAFSLHINKNNSFCF